MLLRLSIVCLVLAQCGCTVGLPRSGSDSGIATADIQEPESAAIDLIDPGIPPAIAGQAGWNYQRSAEADLNGDGRTEQVVLTARVELYRGRPAWDDGQPWQVYVEAQDGRRTYLYSQRLQLGTLTMRISHSEPGEPASIILLEHLPDRLSLYEAVYREPGRAVPAAPFQRQLDPRGELASPQFP